MDRAAATATAPAKGLVSEEPWPQDNLMQIAPSYRPHAGLYIWGYFAGSRADTFNGAAPRGCSICTRPALTSSTGTQCRRRLTPCG